VSELFFAEMFESHVASNEEEKFNKDVRAIERVTIVIWRDDRAHMPPDNK
jgi:hypothetical protein